MKPTGRSKPSKTADENFKKQISDLTADINAKLDTQADKTALAKAVEDQDANPVKTWNWIVGNVDEKGASLIEGERAELRDDLRLQ